MNVSKYLRQMDRRPPASEASVSELLNLSGHKLPTDFIEFMRQTDGAVGTIGKAYVVFFSAHEMIHIWNQNRAFGNNRYFSFGSDGSNAYYAFDFASSDVPIVKVDKIDEDVMKVIAADFGTFLENISHEALPESDIHFDKAQIDDFMKRSGRDRHTK